MTDTQQPTLKEMLEGDIEILLGRFKKFQFDHEERSWHLKRYFTNLNITTDLIDTLKQTLKDRLEKLVNEVSLTEEDEKTLEILQQFYNTAEKITL